MHECIALYAYIHILLVHAIPPNLQYKASDTEPVAHERRGREEKRRRRELDKLAFLTNSH